MPEPQPYALILERLAGVIADRRSADPSKSYVARLLSKGEDAILKKIGEEATETVMAGKDGATERIISETADLWFHCLVMLEFYQLSVGDVLRELERREGLSGLDEKAARKAEERE
jgi:phosphoribosyl-ATP pyrophosphohydrolase